MRYYDKLILDTAKELGRKPAEIEAISAVFDTFDMLSANTQKEIESLGVISSGKRLPLPPKLKAEAIEIVKKHGDLAKFFSPMMKPKYFKSFAKKFLEQRKQPADYLFSGALYYKQNKQQVITFETEEKHEK